MTSSFVIPADLVRTVERRAAQRGLTPGALVEELVRRGLADEPAPEPSSSPPYEPAFPTFSMGASLVDLGDREAMDELLNGERDRRLYGGLYGRRSPDDAG